MMLRFKYGRQCQCDRELGVEGGAMWCVLFFFFFHFWLTQELHEVGGLAFCRWAGTVGD